MRRDDLAQQRQQTAVAKPARHQPEQNLMIDARKVGLNIDLHEPGVPRGMRGGSLHRCQGPFAGATGVGVENERPIQHRSDLRHDGVMRHAVREARGMDQPRFRVADAESPQCAGAPRAVPQRGAEPREVAVEIAAEDNGFMLRAFALRGEAEGRVEIVRRGDIVQSDGTAFHAAGSAAGSAAS